LDFFKLNQLLRVAQAQLDKLNLIETLNSEADNSNLLNAALEDVIFLFTKVSEEELILADQLRGQLKRTHVKLYYSTLIKKTLSSFLFEKNWNVSSKRKTLTK